MSEGIVDKLGVAGVIALAAAAILVYSLWGASLLNHEREAAASGSPASAVATR